MISVFVGDDHAIMREGLVQLLQLDGLEVVGTGSEGHQCLQRILELRPHVAVLDISMEGLNGLQIARQIAETDADVKVVIVSMHSSAQHVFSALEAGARAYVEKESAASEIVRAIRAVQEGRRYLSTRVAGIVAAQVGRHAALAPLDSLSARERQILQLVAQGHSSSQIGLALDLSPKTVETYRSRVMYKLDLPDVVSLVKFALRHGLISLQ